MTSKLHTIGIGLAAIIALKVIKNRNQQIAVAHVSLLTAPSVDDPPINVPYDPDDSSYTITYNDHVVPQELYYAIDNATRQSLLKDGTRVPIELLLAISWAEGNFYNGQSRVPATGDNAVNDFGNGYENSWGPWQLLRKSDKSKYGGVGDPYTPYELLHPITSAMVATKYIRDQIDSGKSVYDTVEAWHSRSYFWPEYMKGNKVQVNMAGHQ